VLGHPIGHSLSPVMHRAAYRALGLTDWVYEAIDVDVAELGQVLAGVDGSWAGLSLTMPLKRAVGAFLVDVSDLAQQVGAVNTVVVEDAGGSDGVRLHGYNTDVYGIIRALGEIGATELTGCVVLGGGATAASTLAAARDLGCGRPQVLVRSRDRAAHLGEAASRLGIEIDLGDLDAATAAWRIGALPEGSAVVSTLPAGAGDALAEDLAGAARGQLPALLDVCYDPWPTPLARAWSAAGGAAVGGFAMLVHQAEGQVRLMTGRRPPLEVMRTAGQAELDRRTGVPPGGAAHPTS